MDLIKFPISEADLLTILIIAFVIIVILYFVCRWIFEKVFILEEELSSEDGFVSTKDLTPYMGKTGIALTVLRPGGTVEIGNERIDARADGEFIEKDEKIEVIGIDGAQLVVDQPKTDS